MHWESPPLTLTIPSDARLISVVRGFVDAVCQLGNLDQTTTDSVVLATNEATHNIIQHAHRDNPNALIHIECRLGASRLEICLLDEGEPFNLAGVPFLDPGEIRIGGRGVFLMRALMDELICHPRGKRGNALKMVKRYGQKSSVSSCADRA